LGAMHCKREVYLRAAVIETLSIFGGYSHGDVDCITWDELLGAIVMETLTIFSPYDSP